MRADADRDRRIGERRSRKERPMYVGDGIRDGLGMNGCGR